MRVAWLYDSLYILITEGGVSIMNISRQDKACLPNFSNHQEAQEYFKSKYAEQFIMLGTDSIDEVKLYFYKLILSPLDFDLGQEKIKTGNFFAEATRFIKSYQRIYIFEDGNVHIAK